MLETIDSVIVDVQAEIGKTSSALTIEGYQSAVMSALAELRWALPMNDTFKEHWLVKRAKRHALFILLTESAHKFKYKQINLQNRFDNYVRLVNMLDEEFARAIEADPAAFIDGVNTDTFGLSIKAGFVYDGLGNDITGA